MDFDLELISAVKEIGDHYPKSEFDFGSIPQQHGWVTSARVREHIGANSLETRKGLKHLAVEGYLENETFEQVDFFRLSALGDRALAIAADSDDPIRAVASDWTGIIEPVQIQQVLRIVSEIEDVAEGIQDNMMRSQILGLVQALKVLLDLPQPPKKGVVELVRDPAFANIVQIGTFLAAIIAALKA